MHVMTKVTLSIGGVLLLISTVALAIGGSSFGDWATNGMPNGEEYWTGDTSSTFSGELDVLSLYYVFVEEGYEVDVEIWEGDDVHWDAYGYFTPCEEWGDCDLYDLPGYDYIGDLGVDMSGDYFVEFTENEGRSVDVMIREDKIPLGGIMGLSGGCCGLCGALLLLMLGGILALTLKDQPKVQARIQFDNEAVDVNEDPEASEYNQDYSS